MKVKISVQKNQKKKLIRNKKSVNKKIKTEEEKRKQVLDLYLKGKLKRSRNKKVRYKKIPKTNLPKIYTILRKEENKNQRSK